MNVYEIFHIQYMTDLFFQNKSHRHPPAAITLYPHSLAATLGAGSNVGLVTALSMTGGALAALAVLRRFCISLLDAPGA